MSLNREGGPSRLSNLNLSVCNLHISNCELILKAEIVSDIAIFVPKRDVKLQLTNLKAESLYAQEGFV